MRLHKRGRTWYTWFYERGVRVHRSTQCQDRKAAESVARQWERDAADPHYAATQAASLSDALQLLLENRSEKAAAGRGSPDTVDFYRKKAGHLVRVLETDEGGAYRPFRLKDLTAALVDSYVSARRKEGSAENSIYKELVTLRAALKLALRKGIWDGNPAAIIPVAFAPEYKPRERALSPEELRKLIAQLTADRAARVAFIVATSANWRETELATRADVNEELSFALIRGTKRRLRFRTVPIVSPASKDLLRFAVEHAEGTEGMLFARWSNVRRDLIVACEKAGIPPCSPNDLRRTFATWLRADGLAPDLIAPAMGHADSRMVERVYGRLSPQALGARMAAALGLPGCNAFATTSVESPGSSALFAQDGARKSAEEVPRAGIEPATRGFSVPCSTN